MACDGVRAEKHHSYFIQLLLPAGTLQQVNFYDKLITAEAVRGQFFKRKAERALGNSESKASLLTRYIYFMKSIDVFTHIVNVPVGHVTEN